VKRTWMKQLGPEDRRDRTRVRAYGSAERISWLHSLPCVAQDLHRCWHWDMDRGGPHIQAVHVKARGAGGGADDQVPGCAGVQEEAGELGTSRRAVFEADTGLDLVARAAELAEDWRAIEAAMSPTTDGEVSRLPGVAREGR
jgi:hypothetical protein